MSIEKRTIDKNTPVPLYYQLKQIILSEIKEGNYPTDSMIPTEEELSAIFSISRTTVRQAVTELVNEGWLYRIKSKGTFTSRPKISQDFLSKIRSYNDEMRLRGFEPRTEVLKFETVRAGKDVSDALKLPEESKAILLCRKRYIGNDPLVFVTTYLPFDSCRFVLEKDFSKESLYANLDASDETKIVKIERRIEAVEATNQDAKYLSINKGKPVQYTVSIGYNVYNQPIEYSLARYRGDLNSFTVTVIPEG